MREMKDSGIEWIGKIPADWNVMRLGGLYSLRNEKVSDQDYMPLSVTNKGIVPQLDTAAKTNAHDDRKLVRKGDFAINSRSDRRGSCGISACDGSVSLINTVLKPLDEMHPGYYNWLFHTIQFADEFYKWGHGIVDDLWTTNWQEMKKISVPVPTVNEQNSISAYIDSKCEKIDSLSRKIRTQIDVLEGHKQSIISEAVTKGLKQQVEMRESGIDYIGKINADWKLSRIGFTCKKLERPVLVDSIPLICSNSGEVVPRGDTNVGLVSDNDAMFQGVMPGDLLIHGMDTWHGAIAISQYEGKCTTVVHVCDSTEDKRFIMYYLQMLAFKKVYKAITNGVRGNTSDFRSWDKAASIYITLPSREEQEKIADYIDNKVLEIKSIIADKQKLLDILDAYKKSLIFEYVTGKKEVI